MRSLLAAAWLVTLFCGGAWWIVSLICVIFFGRESFSQPVIWISLVGVPLTLGVLNYLMGRTRAS